MLNRLIVCIVLGGILLGAPAAAQKPKPSPSPAPGENAFTDNALKSYNQAQADYEALSRQPGASLDALDAAYKKVGGALSDLHGAISAEAGRLRDVLEAEADEHAKFLDYLSLKKSGRDYEAEEKAKSAYLKAARNTDSVRARAESQIQDRLRVTLPFAYVPNRTQLHEQLRSEKIKADEAAKKKAEAEKKAQEQQQQQNTEPKKTSCAPGRGLGGAIENVACQDQHSGSGH